MYDVCLGGHVACTTTSKKAADAIRKVFAAHADDLYQHSPVSVREVDRGPAPAAKPPKKKAAKKK